MTTSSVLTRRLTWAIATVCGLGFAPIAPGTVASVAAAGFWYWLWPTTWVQAIACIVLTTLGIWAAGCLATHLGDKDPAVVVIDEVAGMWCALLGLPKHLLVVCLAVALFRVLDITKPPPMRQLERLPGGVGIVLDDVAAGLIVRGILAIAVRF